MIAADKLEKFLLKYRAHEDNPGVTTKIYEEYMKKLEKAQNGKEVDKIVSEAMKKK